MFITDPFRRSPASMAADRIAVIAPILFWAIVFVCEVAHAPEIRRNTGGFAAIVALPTGFGNDKSPSPRAKGSGGFRLRHSDAEMRLICVFKGLKVNQHGDAVPLVVFSYASAMS